MHQNSLFQRVNFAREEMLIVARLDGGPDVPSANSGGRAPTPTGKNGQR